MLKVAALYQFAALPDFRDLREPLRARAAELGVKGSILLAEEGINGTVAGTPDAIDELATYLQTNSLFANRLHGAEIKYSAAATMPFLRMKVRLKSEIVTLRAPEANPAKTVGTYVQPKDWNALIDRNDVVLVDTRNDYEVGLGTFTKALDPATIEMT